MQWENEDGSQGDKIYVVTHAVGRNATNKRDDVLLVQYFLKKIYDKPGKASLTRPTTPMVVDGYFGTITRNWILMFQNDLKRLGYSVWADGRVDPTTGDTRGTISKEIYTIFHLDNGFKFRYPEIHANMANSPDVPGELRASLK
jgi:hypothetical protein